MVQEGPREPLSYYFRDLLLASEPQASRLYLVRHAQSAAARDEWQPDPPITALGQEQARLVGERLARDGIDAIYSSPLRRAAETARAIAQASALPITTVEDLREVEVGPAEEDADSLSPEERETIRRRLAEKPSWDALPGSEGSGPFRTRIAAAIEGIVHASRGKRVAVVTHGGVIQTYVSLILGLEGDVYFYPFNTSITSIRALDQRRVLWRLNDVAHLNAMPPGMKAIT